MNRKYKAVLFGNGTMGERHRRFFEYSGVQFLKVFDVEDLDDAGNLKTSLIDEFVSNEKIDFAVIASPATTHYQYARLCLERKISVFVEKPLATFGEQAQELVDLSIRNNVILFVAQSECFNSVFLNFRKHFMNEIGASGNAARMRECADSSFRLEFRRELEKFTISKNEDRAQMQISIVKGAHAGAEFDFVVDRNSDIDVRTISVEFVNDDGSPSCDYSVSLAPHNENGEVVHISDSLENEHKFFLKLMAGACSEWGRRAAQCAANAVKLATITTASS